MKSNLEKALLFQQYSVQLQFRKNTRFHYFHGPALNALLCNSLDRHPLGKGFVIFPVESGRVLYKAGDCYNFSITVFGNTQFNATLLQEKLQNPSHPANLKPPLGGNYDTKIVKSIPKPKYNTDIFESQPDNILTLQFITPLRLGRAKPQKGHSFFDHTYFDATHFFKMLCSRIYTLANFKNNTPLGIVPKIPTCALIKNSTVWIDAPFRKTLGGIMGQVQIDLKLTEEWKQLLWLGQFTHVGNNSAMGFGRYRIILADLNNSEICPAQSILERSIETENLLEAFKDVKQNRGSAGEDKQSIEEYENSLYENLDSLRSEIKKGKYHSRDLYGLLISKPSSKIRALAIPTVKDRIFQRAVVQTIAPVIDQLLEDCSFAYRKGFSRQGAARAIQRAYQDGFRYVLESDIKSFFDDVDWNILFDKLDALFPMDPVVPIIKDWVTRPVVFHGQRINREKGLPQGAVISPLLANLFLDEFDEALQDDYRLVRYADDFVILCKSYEQASKALDQVKTILKKLELEINVEKTRIVNFDQGFQYLGYLFCRSVIIELKKKKKNAHTDSIFVPLPEDIPQESWLTLVDFQKIRQLSKLPKSRAVKIQPLVKELTDTKRFPVYISDPSISVRLSHQSLKLSNQDRTDNAIQEIPINRIGAVVVIGRSRITLPAVMRLSENNISTFFCHQNGETYFTIPGSQQDWSLWLKQVELTNNHPFIIQYARSIVCSKINNYAVLIRRQNWDSNVFNKMRSIENRCENETEIDSIRGYEGKAAALYFSLLAENLPPQWRFTKRIKNPPPNPVNAMLSFGYSILYYHLSTALQAAGLNPAIGWYHQMRGNYHALACDLQEEFRYIVDSLVIYMIHKNMIRPDDFFFPEQGAYPCLMKNEFRKKFIGQMEKKLLVLFKPGQEEFEMTYRQFFYHQAELIKKIVFNQEIRYVPLRIR